ncbi:acyltransferase [Methanolobus vulcani]|uniref:Acyltransferase n=1 Tax=Methanolobus vulcani TaxID=38026 RepID=A0A7Z8KRG4_9EURY|nr:acyltransferase [Methanolobus vulcani]
MLCFKFIKKILKILAKYSPVNGLRILFLRLSGYSIGHDVYIAEDLIITEELNNRKNLIIGDRVSIGPRVTFVTSSNPNNSKIYPYVSVKSGCIIIEDDVWIGSNAVILPNVVIGKASVVGACALVTKSVSPFTIVGGVPAKVIGELNVKKKDFN